MKTRVLVIFVLALLAVSCSTQKKAVVVAPPPPPVVVKDTVKVNQAEVVPAPVLKKKYHIGLLLPLQLEAHFANDSTADTDPLIIPQAVPALNFYEGALAAVDSFADTDVEVNLHVFDVSVDSLDVVSLLQGPDLRKCDAVISLLPATWNTLCATKWGSETKPFIILQHNNTQPLENHPGLWLSTPANATQVRQMAQYIATTNAGDQIITVYRDQRKENELAEFINAGIDSAAGAPGTALKVSFTKSGWSGVKAKLSKTKNNVLVVPTSDASWLTSLMSSMEEEKDNYRMTMVGLPTWENFETIDPSRLAVFKATYFSAQHIDVNEASTKIFRKAFIDAYHTDPALTAYQAFDLIEFLAGNFSKSGTNYADYKGIPNMEYPNAGFNFVPTGEGNGRENRSMAILKYGDYVLVRVR